MARGSAVSLAKTCRKKIIGHSHSPCIVDGIFQVGTLTKLRLEYNLGASSWMNANAVIYPDGHRSLLFIVNGNWR